VHGAAAACAARGCREVGGARQSGGGERSTTLVRGGGRSHDRHSV
jgi:hypothetical protein